MSTGAAQVGPTAPPRRRRPPSEPLDLVAACHRVIAKTTDPRKQDALRALAFNLLKARQRLKGASR